MIDYPDKLFPQEAYRENIDLSSLLKSHDYQLSRRIDMSFDEATDDLDGERFLKSSVIEQFDERLSMNILGTPFSINDTCFVQKGVASKTWQPGMIINKTELVEDIDYREGVFPAVFEASELTQTIPYDRSFEKKQDADRLLQSLGRMQDNVNNNTVNCKMVTAIPSSSFVKHSPTLSNYWHAELQVKPSPDDLPLTNVKASWKKSLLRQYREQCFANTPMKQYDNDDSFNKVEEEWYIV